MQVTEKGGKSEAVLVRNMKPYGGGGESLAPVILNLVS
jgi:hypothetical protein